MPKRREPRKEVKLPVRIFGTDSSGQVFSEKVVTADISRYGARLSGVPVTLTPGDIIGLAYKTNKGKFKVKWVGQANTPITGQIGLLNQAPDKQLWDVPLPDESYDLFQGDTRDRRASPRIKCVCPLELHTGNQATPTHARTADLSLGGCFIDMPLPLPKGTAVSVGLWIKETKVWASGKVVTCTPGFGVGVQFNEMSAADKELLREFLRGMTRIRI